MPLKRRQKSGTDLYHVIAKGINKERTFNQSREKTYLKKIIKKIKKKYENVEIYAYCIMSNHIHLILKAEFPELSLFMAAVLAEYANYYNYKHHRNGHVFQNRFVSECIETERYFWNCLRYIHLNPVKARVVKEAARYANVKHFFTLLGKMFFTSYGKEFFTYLGKQIFTSYGKYFFTLPGKQIFYIPVSPCGYRSGCFSR